MFCLYSIQNARTPNLPKICPIGCFGGFRSGGRNCANLSKFVWKLPFRQILTNFSNIWTPSLQPPNNRWDKFWTNLGFGAFLNAVRGKRFHKMGCDIPKVIDFRSLPVQAQDDLMRAEIFPTMWSRYKISGYERVFHYRLMTVIKRAMIFDATCHIDTRSCQHVSTFCG